MLDINSAKGLTNMNGGKLEDILEVFKQVQIDIPFLDAI
jgi:hypothetical protein